MILISTSKKDKKLTPLQRKKIVSNLTDTLGEKVSVVSFSKEDYEDYLYTKKLRLSIQEIEDKKYTAVKDKQALKKFLNTIQSKAKKK